MADMPRVTCIFCIHTSRLYLYKTFTHEQIMLLIRYTSLAFYAFTKTIKIVSMQLV